MLQFLRLKLFYASLEPFSRKTRKARMAMFLEVMKPAPGMRVLDLGGQPEIWDSVQPTLDITCVNLPGVSHTSHRTHHRVTYVEGDACDLHQFHRRDFDIVFSNSVIEHVGDGHRRFRFAREVLRLSDHYWIQTPSRWFPLEAHCGMPLWWFYPEALRAWFLRRWRRKLPAWAEMVAGTSVVSPAELKAILPGCEIRYERIFGLTKSMVAHSRAASGAAPTT
jgi:SAM-dependent methyltransferase